MKVALIAFLFFIFIALISGTVKMPTGDDITLLIASFSLFAIAWLKKREKKSSVDQIKEGELFQDAPDENKGK